MILQFSFLKVTNLSLRFHLLHHKYQLRTLCETQGILLSAHDIMSHTLVPS